MAKKQYQKVKEPVRIRFKELANGNRSIYEQVDPKTPALGRSQDPASVFAILPKALSL